MTDELGGEVFANCGLFYNRHVFATRWLRNKTDATTRPAEDQRHSSTTNPKHPKPELIRYSRSDNRKLKRISRTKKREVV